ncbi:TetR/AcrR family transcriptional regulator [Desulfomicrobium baculatum]|uniref:Transcriptional regulator, TetR family n=1 Tax=Desulfomicrobium baculatum (strain DSM 4028 / VKM B-1378 / X) TaxID=525897 RepID=C7LNE5_DESBD|nr:TetR/AcrR family transcriptional regulator [Desulfomicrobium baculatum]ACU90114.1 transcriptional regulator, TetR family [Desulfomicrobium baculatum DSM 4028]
MATGPTKKELLLKAAKELFSEHGYSETTFKKISERAGVALGLLTHHFGNKEKLFLTAGLDVVHELVQTMRTNLQGVPNGLEAVRLFAKTYFDFARNPRQDFMVLVRCSPFSDLKTVEDKDVMIRNFSELYDILEECVERGVHDGSIRSLDPHKTSVVVFCNLVGGIRHGLLTPYGDEGLFDDIVEFVIYGLKAR